MPPPALLAATCETPIFTPFDVTPGVPVRSPNLLTRHGDGSAVHCRASAVHAVDIEVTTR
jgi:hypothetical protein